MAYMLMLVTNDSYQLDAVLKAWDKIEVDDVVFMDSTSFHREGITRPHIPMRFMFEKLEQNQYSITLFGIVKDEATVQECLAQAEMVIGDLHTATSAMFAAWPVSIVKGIPKQPRNEGEAAP